MATTARSQNYLWDDGCVVPPSAIDPVGPDAPMTVITAPADYLGCLQADAIGESCIVNFQVPHSYARGTDIKPHIHVVRNDNSDNTGNVEFEAKFRVIPLQGTAFAWTAHSDGSTAVQPADGADKSGLISWTLSNSTYSFGVSDIIICAFRRKALATGSVAVTSADLHIQKGPYGTVAEGGPE